MRTLIFFILLTLGANGADVLTGRVVGITDGDTITLRTTEDTIKVRLTGIDAPERGQPFGTKAKQALSGQVFGKDVTVNSSGEDRYGRTLGEIIVNGESVNVRLVRGPGGTRDMHPTTHSCEMLNKRRGNLVEGCGLIRTQCRRGSGGGASVEGPLVGG